VTLYLTRRQKLSACIGALVMAVLGRSGVARADQAAVDQLVRQFAGGRTPVVDRVKLDLPSTTDDGSSVRITVSVDIPPRENTYVTDLLVVADGNTQPTIVTFHFSPMSVPEASTRVRLAKPSAGAQSVTAVARLNNGSCYRVTQAVTVTNAGCM
jgi:sulfur-oxidizing protein SoxY